MSLFDGTVGPLDYSTPTTDAPATGGGGGFFSGLKDIFSGAASVYGAKTNADLQTALGKQNAKTAAAQTAAAQANQSSTLKIVLIIGGAVAALATVLGLIALLRK